jgi:hypothetical protein
MFSLPPSLEDLYGTTRPPCMKRLAHAFAKGEHPLNGIGSPAPNGYHSWVHLASDYIHPTPRDGRCRIRIYLPEEERDAPLVICSELRSNEGSSVTYSAHQIAAEETFELVVFPSHEVKERAPYLGETRLTIGEPTWKTLDREAVEVLVGREV